MPSPTSFLENLQTQMFLETDTPFLGVVPVYTLLAMLQHDLLKVPEYFFF